MDFADRTREFIDFVLDHYVSEGVEELDIDRLPSLLELKYDGLLDALAKIGADEEVVSGAFCDFQKYLYEESVGAA